MLTKNGKESHVLDLFFHYQYNFSSFKHGVNLVPDWDDIFDVADLIDSQRMIKKKSLGRYWLCLSSVMLYDVPKKTKLCRFSAMMYVPTAVVGENWSFLSGGRRDLSKFVLAFGFDFLATQVKYNRLLQHFRSEERLLLIEMGFLLPIPVVS